MSDNYETVTTDEPTETDADSLDSGNRKLGLIAGGVLLLLGVAMAFGPEANRQRIANGQMPSFELAGASVVGERATEEAAAPVATPATEEASVDKDAAKATKATPRTTTTATASTATNNAAVAAAPVAEETAAPEPATPAAAPAVEEAPRTVVFSGRVLDENGQPLAGATVFVKGTRKFASTDQNGNYSVEAPAGDNSLVYGYGGYQDQEMRASGGQKNNVTLIPSETSKRKRR
ncbi:hypothetical protein GCM10027048_44130 [Hymenobacter coalescens]